MIFLNIILISASLFIITALNEKLNQYLKNKKY